MRFDYSAWQHEVYHRLRDAGWDHQRALERAAAQPEQQPAPYRVVAVLSDSKNYSEPVAEFETYREAVKYLRDTKDDRERLILDDMGEAANGPTVTAATPADMWSEVGNEIAEDEKGVGDTSCHECGDPGGKQTPEGVWLCWDFECERTYYGWDVPEGGEVVPERGDPS